MSLESHLTQFRLSAFRPGQEEVIRTVLDGRDCLCVMPTGGGKSLCYQLPAMVLDGLTVVVSPLIALMKDQVDQLTELGLPVTFINSTLTQEEQNRRLDAIASGQVRMVYAVPERFRSSRFIEAVRSAGLSLLAVDEAHCISQWGHDFRPDYARLGSFRRMLGNPPTIALTATATSDVQRDIVSQLQFEDPATFVRGFARENLFYRVHMTRGERDKTDRLIEFLQKNPGSGIIYASTRKRTEEVAEAVNKRLRRKVIAYHAGLMPNDRKAAQEAFMQGKVELIAATNAFGMGIDKADVRFVIHYNLPGTLEGYYQEAGRAGRDGLPSECLLLYNASDRYLQEWFIDSAYPDRETVELVYKHLASLDADPLELTQQEIKATLSLSIGADGVGTCEQLLESAGVLQRLVSSDNRATVRIDSPLPTLVDLLPRRAKVRRAVLRAVEQLVGSRRGEIVAFQPFQLQQTTGLEQPSVAAALRELNELEAFDYVPPFRGRAIRMLDRETPFEQLDIDFESLEKRRAYEYEKLNRVIQFAIGATCRQQTILHYFGEADGQTCGHCDNCNRHGHEPGAPLVANLNDEAVKSVRIALSGVARVQQRFRCDKTLIAQMLCGSKAAKLTKLGLDQLSTFAMLEHLSQVEVVEVLEALVATGHLAQVDLEQHRPVLELTTTGIELMKGNRECEGVLPVSVELLGKLRGDGPPPPAPPQSEDAPLDVDHGLLTQLKDWRKTKGSQTGQPLYRILTNRTLDQLAADRPTTRDALLAVSGIGPRKLEQYGQELLELMAGESPPAREHPRVDEAEQDAASPEQTAHPQETGSQSNALDAQLKAISQAWPALSEDDRQAVLRIIRQAANAPHDTATTGLAAEGW